MIHLAKYYNLQITFNIHTHEWLCLSEGVPQGAIFALTIFTFFASDFCWLFIEGFLVNYADDNSLCIIRELLLNVKYTLETVPLQKAIRWFEENLTRANPNKFSMHSTHQNTDH